jgi:hypothetical protein
VREVVDRIAEVDGQDAVSEVRACFDRIAAILIETAEKAERINDAEMLVRLIAAKAAADRGGELASQLSLAFQDQSSMAEASGIRTSEL